MAARLAVATVSYATYAFFNIVSPQLTIALAYAGILMLRLPAAPGQPNPKLAESAPTRLD